MPTTSRAYALDRALLLAPSLRGGLTADHLACFISKLVDKLDLAAFHVP